MSFFSDLAGGIFSSGSSDVIRSISVLSSGLPGTIANEPPRSAKDPSLVSSRSFALRLLASGP